MKSGITIFDDTSEAETCEVPQTILNPYPTAKLRSESKNIKRTRLTSEPSNNDTFDI
jgi:hypothetical protein